VISAVPMMCWGNRCGSESIPTASSRLRHEGSSELSSLSPTCGCHLRGVRDPGLDKAGRPMPCSSE
jgi:hypothetical protein